MRAKPSDQVTFKVLICARKRKQFSHATELVAEVSLFEADGTSV